MFETMSIANVNSWISGGGGLVVLTSIMWCRMKIKQQCNIITELQKDVKKKADIKTLEKMDERNAQAHDKLFDKIDELPEKIMRLIGQ